MREIHNVQKLLYIYIYIYNFFFLLYKLNAQIHPRLMKFIHPIIGLLAPMRPLESRILHIF